MGKILLGAYNGTFVAAIRTHFKKKTCFRGFGDPLKIRSRATVPFAFEISRPWLTFYAISVTKLKFHCLRDIIALTLKQGKINPI